MTTDGLSHVPVGLSDLTSESDACTPSQEECIAEAAELLALAIAEQAELVATEGVAAAARAAGCVTDSQIAAWAARFFPGAAVELREAS